jgi:ribonuclease HI
LKNQDIRVFTDFAQSRNQWYKHKQGVTINSSVFKDIIELSKHCASFDINYVKSHVNSNTPNKACDILARRYRQ